MALKMSPWLCIERVKLFLWIGCHAQFWHTSVVKCAAFLNGAYIQFGQFADVSCMPASLLLCARTMPAHVKICSGDCACVHVCAWIVRLTHIHLPGNLCISAVMIAVNGTRVILQAPSGLNLI